MLKVGLAVLRLLLEHQLLLLVVHILERVAAMGVREVVKDTPSPVLAAAVLAAMLVQVALVQRLLVSQAVLVLAGVVVAVGRVITVIWSGAARAMQILAVAGVAGVLAF